MKKTLFFIVALTLLASCAKTVEIVDESKVSPEESVNELTLNTIANPTKAVAEGTKVPIDNVIGFFPNFHSDLSSADFSSYNEIGLFGYDPRLQVWRNVDLSNPINGSSHEEGGASAPGLGIQIPLDFNFAPIYWPAGDRVFMDYVACSFSSVLTMIHEILPVLDNEAMAVEPLYDNPNRMSVNYEYKMPENGFFWLERPTVDNLEQILLYIPLINAAGFQTGISDTYLDTFSNNYKDDYATAIVNLNSGQDLTEAEIDALNRGYELYVKCYPVINKFMQDDLLYAHDRNLKNDNHGAVKATFNHSKAWVKVIVNNQTKSDIYVSDIRFNDVKSSGTLVIDNSKSQFETYWNFTQPSSAIGASISPYSAVYMDGSTPDKPSDKPDKPTKPDTETDTPGLIPDVYLVPAGCYGPAISISEHVDIADGPVTALDFEYLGGTNPFNISNTDCSTMVGKLSGMMFPAQEPGMITIEYAPWEHNDEEFTTRDGHIIHTFDVQNLWKGKSSNYREITLNLSRQTWQMGKVYVYVLTIGGDEITIEPLVTDWQYANPIYYPSDEGQEQPAEDDSQIENFGANVKPDWGLEASN